VSDVQQVHGMCDVIVQLNSTSNNSVTENQELFAYIYVGDEITSDDKS